MTEITFIILISFLSSEYLSLWALAQLCLEGFPYYFAPCDSRDIRMTSVGSYSLHESQPVHGERSVVMAICLRWPCGRQSAFHSAFAISSTPNNSNCHFTAKPPADLITMTHLIVYLPSSKHTSLLRISSAVSGLWRSTGRSFKYPLMSTEIYSGFNHWIFSIHNA